MNRVDDASAGRDERNNGGMHRETDTGQTAYKRHLAYRCLGINPKEVLYIPFLAIQFRRIARKIRAGGVEDPTATPLRPLEYLVFSEDPQARAVLTAYRSVPASYRRLLRPEDFCHAAGVSPWRVLDIIVSVAVRQVVEMSAIIGAVLHPSVVEKTLVMAMQPGGTREREMIHRATGFLGTGRRLY
jgi:hypothetical protein